MIGHSGNADRRFLPARTVLLLAVGCGLTTGSIDAAYHWSAMHFANAYLLFSPHFVWMAPLADLGLFLVGASGLLLLRHRWPAFGSPVAVMVVLFFLSFASLLFLVPGLHRVPHLLLAAGLAWRTAVLLRPRLDVVEFVVRCAVPGMMLAVGVMAVSMTISTRMLEQRNLPPARKGSPNILVLVLDTVRASNLSLYGYSRDTTPNLDGFRGSMVVFDRAIAPSSWTLPSHASMFTGLPANDLSANWSTSLDQRVPTVAEVLSEHGYTTAGFVANPWYAGRVSGIARGFAHFEDYQLSVGEVLNTSSLGELLFAGRINSTNIFRRVLNYDEPFGRKNAEEVREDVTNWLDSRDETRPFFAFLNWYDAHAPYRPPSPFAQRFRREDAPGSSTALDRYDGAIAYMDAQFDLLLRSLRERSLHENTIVVVTSDHGEQFGEHGLFRHGNSLYLPALHVPLTVILPSNDRVKLRVEEPVSLTELAPTLLVLAGIEPPSGFDHHSLVEHWRGSRPAAGDEVVLSEVRQGIRTPPEEPVSRGDMVSYIADGMHFIRNGDGREELYDLAKDPGELHNLIGSGDLGPRELRLRKLAASRAKLN